MAFKYLFQRKWWSRFMIIVLLAGFLVFAITSNEYNPKILIDKMMLETTKTFESSEISQTSDIARVSESSEVAPISKTADPVKNKELLRGDPPNSLACYTEKVETLPDISSISPRPGKSIFFLETSCRSFLRGKISITARQACAVESAALLNPDLDVYLLFCSPGIIKCEDDESDRFLAGLLSIKNIKIMHLDFGKYAKMTPVEKLFSTGQIQSSNYVVPHSSDVLRILTMWKYGGYYLDLDVIVIKSLQDLPLNFAGLEWDDALGNGVLSFDPSGIGHQLMEKCLNYLKDNFDGVGWGNNGPALITSVLKDYCNVTIAKQIRESNCSSATAYPVETFYPIPYHQWKLFFEENSWLTVKKAIKHTYAVHFWNKMSVDESIPLNSSAPYLRLAKKYCPRVVEACDMFF